uniref:SHSP domain-containing protein n=1 Tax=Ascaris lumbricoides TaxID=6252 RepID=A0A0M3IDJ8_ASCLU
MCRIVVSYISVMYRNVLVSDMTYSTDAVLMPYRIIRDMHNDQLFGCQIGEAINEPTRFCVSINAQNFKANELMVDISGNVLTIEAFRDGDPSSNGVKCHFLRRYTIPDDLQTEYLHAYLNNNGVLTVTISKKPSIHTVKILK